MDFLIYLFYFVFGILCFIMFFKIWGMTNDIDKIYKKVCSSRYDDVNRKFADFYLCGEYDEAYKLLNHYLSNEINRRFGILSRNDDHFKKTYEEQIANLVNKYSSKYQMIGKEIPENIKNVTYDSYIKLV